MTRLTPRTFVFSLKSPLSQDERRFFVEWLSVTWAALGLLAVFLGLQLTNPLGYLIYDQMRRIKPESPSDEIVVIAVDDASLDRLGGWPMRRTNYATLLERLDASNARPVAIGFDLLFYDPSPEDPLMAAQMRRHRAFLAMEPALAEHGQTEEGRYPVPALRAAASGLVHINAAYETDGFMRGAELMRGGVPHLALAVSGMSYPASHLANPYRRFNLVDPAQGFKTYSFADVVEGVVPASAFKDKYVLIGATAPSLGDHHPTIYSGREATGMPGVELHANILNGLLKGSLVSSASFGASFFISAGAVLLVAAGMFYLGPLAEFSLGVVVVVALLLFSFVMLGGVRWWFDPSAACVVIALLKPTWAWRRADMIIGFLKARATTIESLARSRHPTEKEDFRGDTVLRYSGLLDRAIHVVSESLQLLGGILNESPNAMLVADLRGQIVLANERMAASMPSNLLVPGHAILPFLVHLGFSPLQRIDELSGQVSSVTVTAEQGQEHYMFHAATIRLAETQAPLLLISLVDVTEVRRSQAQRDRALQFLSHDMRTPVAAIIALNRMERSGDQANAEGIQRNAEKLLQLMDDFIFSIKADSFQYRLVESMFETLLDDAIFQVKELSRVRGMRIAVDTDGNLPFVLVETRLLTRAIVNVLVNAVRYGQPGSVIQVRQATCRHAGRDWVRCEITNLVGDPASVAADPAAVQGFGLGGEFISTVIRKHGGRATFSLPQAPGATASVVLMLPLAEMTQAEGAAVSTPDQAASRPT